MPVKREICRNFARGSCQFGQRCKFVHAAAGNQNNNINNPYGFGVQNKGFENTKTNTWSRASASAGAGESHKCSESRDSCRRIMAEDFQNERPLWRLTCYGHWKGLPCDISGDVSYEELRAAAYDDAKRGLPFHSIVERERKLVESYNSSFNQLRLHGATSAPSHSNPAPALSSFTPLGGPTIPFTPPMFNNLPAAQLGGPTVAFTPPVFNNPPAAQLGGPTVAFAPATFNNPPTAQLGGPNVAFAPSMFNNAPANQVMAQPWNSSPQAPSLSLNTSTSFVEPATTTKVDTVWLKPKWIPGEVPEDAPPDAVCS